MKTVKSFALGVLDLGESITRSVKTLADTDPSSWETADSLLFCRRINEMSCCISPCSYFMRL